MKINCSINEFRKDFNKRFQGFYLRIREDSNDIAYYNGIKAFEIEQYEIINNDGSNNIINIFFPINAYKCNPTNVKKNKEINDDFKKLIEPMNSFFDFSMSKISFKKTGYYKEKIARERLQLFKEHVSEIIDVDIEKIIEKLNYINYKQEQEEKENGIRNSETIVSIEFDEITDIDKIMDIQYHFINDLKVKETINRKNELKRSGLAAICKDIEFDFSLRDKSGEGGESQIYDISKLYEFKDAVEKAIINYENQTTINKEKKYQHQFMLGDPNNSILNIYPFEEEYYIKEKDDNTSAADEKNGRIDSIFYKIDNDVLTDVYLIELKVNSEVVAGENGVLTHLDDIKNLINNTNFIEQKEKDFFYKLKKRIRYRMRELEDRDISNNDNKLIDYNIHFFTIVGFTDPKQKNKEKVINYYNSFCSKEGVNLLIENKELTDKFKDKSIYDIIFELNDESKCQIRFFFDENVWDEKKNSFTPKFKDVTNIYFKGINNE